MPVAGLVLTAALVGCAEDQRESATEGIDVDALPILTLQEELRIGSLEDPDYGFSRIRGVDVDRDGQWPTAVWVSSSSIRRFGLSV